MQTMWIFMVLRRCCRSSRTFWYWISLDKGTITYLFWFMVGYHNDPLLGSDYGTITSHSVWLQSSSVDILCSVNHISMSLAIKAWITSVTDGQIDRQTDRIAIAIAAYNTSDACQKSHTWRPTFKFCNTNHKMFFCVFIIWDCHWEDYRN